MNSRQLLGLDGIESPEQVQLAVIVRRRVAQDCNLNVHSLTLARPEAVRELLTMAAIGHWLPPLSYSYHSSHPSHTQKRPQARGPGHSFLLQRHVLSRTY